MASNERGAGWGRGQWAAHERERRMRRDWERAVAHADGEDVGLLAWAFACGLDGGAETEKRLV